MGVYPYRKTQLNIEAQDLKISKCLLLHFDIRV